MKKINNMKKNSVIVMMLCVMVTSGLASCNPFRGTTWLNRLDTTVNGMHVLSEWRFVFVTDSTGKFMIGDEIENVSPWTEKTFDMNYTYNDSSHVVFMTFAERAPITLIYHPDKQILVNQSDETEIYHQVE